MEPMTIRYTLDVETLATYSRGLLDGERGVAAAKQYRRASMSNLLLGAAACAVAPVGIAAGSDVLFGTALVLDLGIGLVALGVLVFVGSMAYGLQSNIYIKPLRQQTELSARMTAGPGITGELSLTIDADGVVAESGYHTSSFPWSSVTNVVRDESTLAMYLVGQRVFVIPIEAFGTGDEAARFADTAEARRDAAGGREAVFAAMVGVRAVVCPSCGDPYTLDETCRCPRCREPIDADRMASSNQM